MGAIDPIKLAKSVEKAVVEEHGGVFYRRYWRFRGGRWYGGAATADCVGCNLACVFCGPVRFMVENRIEGRPYSPKDVARRLMSIAFNRGYKIIRISGGEPTIGFEHLLQVLEETRTFPGRFILETNGILLGWKREFAEALADFHHVHVRVSIKGCNEEAFERLTLAKKEFFEYQLRALRNLLDAGVSFHPAVVASFCGPSELRKLRERLGEIHPGLPEALEVEYIVLYPHVVRSLKRFGIAPKRAYTTKWKLIGEKEFREIFLSDC